MATQPSQNNEITLTDEAIIEIIGMHKWFGDLGNLVQQPKGLGGIQLPAVRAPGGRGAAMNAVQVAIASGLPGNKAQG